MESREFRELCVKLQFYKIENGVFFPDLQTRAEVYFISEELSCCVFHFFWNREWKVQGVSPAVRSLQSRTL